MTLVMAGLRNSGRSLIWTMGEYGWNMTTGRQPAGELGCPGKPFSNGGANRIQNRLIAFLAEHDGSEELYKTLHNELGLTNQEIEAMGFDLAHRYEPDCDDAYQDIVDYIRFEQETSKM